MQQPVHHPGQATATADRVLVKQTLAGDQNAFETLVHRYNVQVFHYIHHYLNDYDRACDVFQHVLLKLFASLPSLLVEERLGPWLFRVAHNCCIDELRKRHVARFSELGWEAEEDVEKWVPLASVVDSAPSPEEMAEQHELQRTLCEAIEELPPKWRSVVLLRYAHQLSFDEIGQRLKIPRNTVKSYFQRARPLLRAILTAQG